MKFVVYFCLWWKCTVGADDLQIMSTVQSRMEINRWRTLRWASHKRARREQASSKKVDFEELSDYSNWTGSCNWVKPETHYPDAMQHNTTLQDKIRSGTRFTVKTSNVCPRMYISRITFLLKWTNPGRLSQKTTTGRIFPKLARHDFFLLFHDFFFRFLWFFPYP